MLRLQTVNYDMNRVADHHVKCKVHIVYFLWMLQVSINLLCVFVYSDGGKLNAKL